jgi:rod shape determining protein RodA
VALRYSDRPAWRRSCAPTSTQHQHWDWLLAAATLALCAFGIVCVYGATAPISAATARHYLDHGVLNFGIAAVVALPAVSVDYRRIRGYVPLLYAGVIVACLAVLVPGIGRQVNGAQGWIVAGPIQLEPSEFAKLAVILLCALILAPPDPDDDVRGARRPELALAVTGLALLLVLAEPALGIAIVLVVLIIALLAVSDVSPRWPLTIIGSVVLAGVLAFNLHLLKPYQEQRFTAFLAAGKSSTGTQSAIGYQARQSLIAIGDGGLTGQGFLHGTQTTGGFVPEQQTDFIFTVAAEEFGFLGAAALLGLFGILLWRGLHIAARAPDAYGRLIAAGITTWLAFQAFTNIGMTLGIMPVTGLPLPLISYGGTSLMVSGIGIGILLNIGRNSRPPS